MGVKKYFDEIDRIRYPKNRILKSYTENIHLSQHRDLKIFYKEYIGEQILSPIITYDKKQIYYPTQLFDLLFQLNYVTRKKIRLFGEYEIDPTHTYLFDLSVKHREIEKVTDGKEISGVGIIRMMMLSSKRFRKSPLRR